MGNNLQGIPKETNHSNHKKSDYPSSHKILIKSLILRPKPSQSYGRKIILQKNPSNSREQFHHNKNSNNNMAHKGNLKKNIHRKTKKKKALTPMNIHPIEHGNPHYKKEFTAYIVVMNLPYMALYIPWKYQNELDPFYIKLVGYFVNIALERGYNYFSLQRISIKNHINFAISAKNFDFLYNQTVKNVEEYFNYHVEEKHVIVQGELIFHCVTTPLIERYGGFFLIAKSIEPHSNIFLTKADLQ